jgi:hypothetical protein
MWQREDHKTQMWQPGAMLTPTTVIDITPAPERLVNRKVTREQLELHHARRTQSIELAALKAATEALEPKESIVDRASRWLREWMEGLR